MTLPLESKAESPKGRPLFNWSVFYKTFDNWRRRDVECKVYLLESEAGRAERDTMQFTANLAVGAALRCLKVLHINWVRSAEIDCYEGQGGSGMEQLVARYAQRATLTADDLVAATTKLGDIHQVLTWSRTTNREPDRNKDSIWWSTHLRGDRQADFAAALLSAARTTYDVVLMDAGARASQPLFFAYLWRLADRCILGACKARLTKEPDDHQLLDIQAWVAERVSAQSKPIVIMQLGSPASTYKGESVIPRKKWWVNFAYCIPDAELHDMGFAGLDLNAWWNSLQSVAANSALREAVWLLMPLRDNADGMSTVDNARVPLLVADRLCNHLDISAVRMAGCYVWMVDELWPLGKSRSASATV